MCACSYKQLIFLCVYDVIFIMAIVDYFNFMLSSWIRIVNHVTWYELLSWHWHVHVAIVYFAHRGCVTFLIHTYIYINMIN